ncbi:universal stress protein [Amycolatopsis sp. PS_44_ISF1]|uniref:universal stress protein n=1 Tax=Amycolatopsis sp. PS_44_ISF1 TaxID=2974917 RepID=UPI0028DE8DF9|nr:universal stress protein [Amycolatopsis sp. PS_44_ISF1]MDT8913620.1 universal stress protein [Amycolatopsis sp. PS_44_ISF1]
MPGVTGTPPGRRANRRARPGSGCSPGGWPAGRRSTRRCTSHAGSRPAQVLLAESARAQLVVAGSRGRAGLTGLLLGSTGQALLHHAACPVMVARTTETQSGREQQ